MKSWKTAAIRSRSPGRLDLAEVGAVPADRTPVRVVEPQQQLHQGALAGAVEPDQRDRLAAGEGEVDPAQHPRLVGPLPVEGRRR
jgi:hypothetical protein